MKFKTDRIKKEYQEELILKNRVLFLMIAEIDAYSKMQFKKEITLTGVLRTLAEQQQIYGKDTKKVSPHMLWHAVDLRTIGFTDEEIKLMVNHINNKYSNNNYYNVTSMAHEVNGFGMHFHIQFCSKN